MSTFENQLKDHLNTFVTAPYLFVGSGLSQRYINLPTWRSLLSNICNTHLPNEFGYYNSKADSLPEASSLMAEELNEIWWKDDKFEDSRKEFKDKVHDKESPLKYETVKLLEQSINVNDDLEEELELLKTINIDGIITTNWDGFLESVFEDFSVYVGQSELLFSNEFNIGNIFKIHGSTNKPNSIVLTQQDYENFRRKNEYLAAKLLTLFVEQPIIFLGYSLQDPNIQSVLKSIINCLDDKNIDKLNGRFIFCEWVEGLETPTFQSGTIVIQGAKNNDVLPIKHLRMDSFIPLYEVLSSMKDRLPVKVLRNMQNMVFDFVKQTEPRDNVYVLAEDLEELDTQDVQFVYGLGITDRISEKGIVGLKQKDLLEDVISQNGYNPNDICEHLLPGGFEKPFVVL